MSALTPQQRTPDRHGDTPLRIVFAGTPEFAVPTLRILLASSYQVSAVYTQPDRPAGRGRRLTASPLKQAAAGLPVYQPRSLRRAETQAELAALAPDLLVVVAYGLLLPQAVLDIPRLGCVNVHASLLPRWRGAAPIQRALLAGDTRTGVSIMRMEAGLDTGPVYAMAALDIAPGTTAGELHDRLAVLGAEALLQTLPEIAAGNAVAEPQDDALACYAAKLEKIEAELDWRQPAVQLARRVLAFNPWPVAQTRFGDTVLRVWRAETLSMPADAAPGTVLAQDSAGVAVATGEGVLRLLEVQLPGRGRVSGAEFGRGRALRGERLGNP